MSGHESYGEPDWTAEERKAIRALERLAARWPDTLTLFSWSGSLVVVRGEDITDDGIRDDRTHHIAGIPNDGGDPNALYGSDDTDREGT